MKFCVASHLIICHFNLILIFAQIQNFKRGDEVIIQSDKNVLKELQEGHGGWNDAMVSVSSFSRL